MVVLILQFLLLGFAFLWVAFLLITVRLGTMWAASHRYGKKHFRGRPDRHRLAAFGTLFFLGCDIGVARWAHVLVPHQMDTLERIVFIIHLPAGAALLVLMLIMMFWKNGMRDSKSHKVLAIPVLLLSALVLVAGILLAAKL